MQFFCACVVGGFTSLTITDFWDMRLCCLTIFAEVSGSYIFTSWRLAQESVLLCYVISLMYSVKTEVLVSSPSRLWHNTTAQGHIYSTNSLSRNRKSSVNINDFFSVQTRLPYSGKNLKQPDCSVVFWDESLCFCGLCLTERQIVLIRGIRAWIRSSSTKMSVGTPLYLFSHTQKVCSLYKRALRNLESWYDRR
jgi:hypothetical protein